MHRVARHIQRMEFSKVEQYCRTIRSGDLTPGKMPRRPSAMVRYAGKRYTSRDILDCVFGTSRRPIVVRPNDYPYDVASTVAHNVMWFHPSKFDSVPESERIDAILEGMYDTNVYHVTWFKNPREWQSVPGVPHVHVFVTEID